MTVAEIHSSKVSIFFQYRVDKEIVVTYIQPSVLGGRCQGWLLIWREKKWGEPVCGPNLERNGASLAR